MEERIALLKKLGFVRLAGGPGRMGTANPLPCKLAGFRRNETPMRVVEVAPFWIAKLCVTNAEFEASGLRHRRPPTSPADRHPATDVTYLEAVQYAAWLSERHGIRFDLPTEEQWTFAAAPFGLEYPWGNEPDRTKALTRGSDVEGPVEVDDGRYGVNWCGLYHIAGNVHEMMRGAHEAPGTGGAASDGLYCVIKGGDWKHCQWSPGVHRRNIIDCAGRAPNIGFRLVVEE